MVEPQGREVTNTEQSWCFAVRGGTGIAVLATLTSRFPEISIIENSLKKIQNSHPILKSKLQYSNTSSTSTSTNTFSLSISPNNFVKVKSFDLSSTSKILGNQTISPFQLILEHELNLNSWNKINYHNSNYTNDIFFATTYALPDDKWVVVFRLHGVGCDRTTAVSLLKELLVVSATEVKEGDGVQMELENKDKVNLGMEDLIPEGKAKKGMLARGMDVLSYSVNSMRLTNLKFKDTKSARSSQVVRFQLNQNETQRIIFGCKSRGIKLCGALGAAGLIAAQSNKGRPEKQRKYAVVTLTDCRSLLEPPLTHHNFGFYHATILNTHVMKGGEKLWELAEKVYVEFANKKKCNRHFTDMADLNYLMCKAIETPSLTSSSALRSSIISVFEDTVIDNTDEKQKEVVGLEDYMGCASVHGIGPSIGIFDTIRDGKLDCVCVYPSPLHSREQMQEFVNKIKYVLLDGSY